MENTMKTKELDRIHALARIARERPLTADESAERTSLRRGNVNTMLATATVIDPEGRDVTPGKLHAAQAAGIMQYL